MQGLDGGGGALSGAPCKGAGGRTAFGAILGAGCGTAGRACWGVATLVCATEAGTLGGVAFFAGTDALGMVAGDTAGLFDASCGRTSEGMNSHLLRGFISAG